MNIFTKIWRWFFGRKKKPIGDTENDFKVLQLATENWEEPEVIPGQPEPELIPERVKPTFDYTPNPNKYWRSFKRGKKVYWKKFYYEQ